MNKCRRMQKSRKSRSALEGRQHNNNTPTKARTGSACSYSSPKNENGGAPGGTNWSKTPRKNRIDDAPASARGVTTPSAARAVFDREAPTTRQEDAAKAATSTV